MELSLCHQTIIRRTEVCQLKSEEQIFRQIHEWAGGDDRVRAVMVNGFCLNPCAPKDTLPDYDVILWTA